MTDTREMLLIHLSTDGRPSAAYVYEGFDSKDKEQEYLDIANAQEGWVALPLPVALAGSAMLEALKESLKNHEAIDLRYGYTSGVTTRIRAAIEAATP